MVGRMLRSLAMLLWLPPAFATATRRGRAAERGPPACGGHSSLASTALRRSRWHGHLKCCHCVLARCLAISRRAERCPPLLLSKCAPFELALSGGGASPQCCEAFTRVSRWAGRSAPFLSSRGPPSSSCSPEAKALPRYAAGQCGFIRMAQTLPLPPGRACCESLHRLSLRRPDSSRCTLQGTFAPGPVRLRGFSDLCQSS